jgi:hypothetical protein
MPYHIDWQRRHRTDCLGVGVFRIISRDTEHWLLAVRKGTLVDILLHLD